MIKPTEEVLTDALRLDTKGRAEISARLLESLEGPPDPDAEAACDEEILRVRE